MKKRCFIVCASLALLVGCSSIDCPLNNVVGLNAGLRSAATGATYTLQDTLTITAAGTDSVLLNRATGIASLGLPLKYFGTTDTLRFRFSDTQGRVATDTLYISHDNIPHFENQDCPVLMFHKIGKIRWTSHALSQMPVTIDSIVVVRPLVDYQNAENIRIYLRTAIQ